MQELIGYLEINHTRKSKVYECYTIANMTHILQMDIRHGTPIEIKGKEYKVEDIFMDNTFAWILVG